MLREKRFCYGTLTRVLVWMLPVCQSVRLKGRCIDIYSLSKSNTHTDREVCLALFIRAVQASQYQAASAENRGGPGQDF
jgi:hypothetical protein